MPQSLFRNLCQLYLCLVVFLGKDVRLSASMADSIAELKKQLEEQEEIDVIRQRWFFSGKLLTDKTRLQDTKIQKDFVIQVIVNVNPSVITNWGGRQRAIRWRKERGCSGEGWRNRSRAWNHFSVGTAVDFCVHFYIRNYCFYIAPFCIFPFSEKHWNTLD